MVLLYTNVLVTPYSGLHSCEEIFYLSHTELENQSQLFIHETWKEADNLENYLLHVRYLTAVRVINTPRTNINLESTFWNRAVKIIMLWRTLNLSNIPTVIVERILL